MEGQIFNLYFVNVVMYFNTNYVILKISPILSQLIFDHCMADYHHSQSFLISFIILNSWYCSSVMAKPPTHFYLLYILPFFSYLQLFAGHDLKKKAYFVFLLPISHGFCFIFVLCETFLS